MIKKKFRQAIQCFMVAQLSKNREQEREYCNTLRQTWHSSCKIHYSSY